MLVALSLSPKHVTPVLTALVSLSSASAALAVVAYLTDVPTGVSVSTIAIFNLIGGRYAPWQKVAPFIQDILHDHHHLPARIAEWNPACRQHVDDLAPGTFVCRKTDFDAQAKQFRKEHGRSAGDPAVEYRLVLAFLKESGNRTIVAFAEGVTDVWTPTSHMYQLHMPFSANRKLPKGLEEAFQRSLAELVDRPRIRHEPNYMLTKSGFDMQQLIVRAQWKWGLIDVVSRPGFITLTESGRLWLQATDEGYEQRLRTRLSGKPRTKGGFVTNNNFYGPSNYVHGVNLGSMSAQQKVEADQERLLSAIRDLLEDEGIPWHDEQLSPIREDLSHALENEDLSLAQSAYYRLRHVLGQLSVGVGGNAAFALLATYFQ